MKRWELVPSPPSSAATNRQTERSTASFLKTEKTWTWLKIIALKRSHSLHSEGIVPSSLTLQSSHLHSEQRARRAGAGEAQPVGWGPSEAVRENTLHRETAHIKAATKSDATGILTEEQWAKITSVVWNYASRGWTENISEDQCLCSSSVIQVWMTGLLLGPWKYFMDLKEAPFPLTRAPNMISAAQN